MDEQFSLFPPDPSPQIVRRAVCDVASDMQGCKKCKLHKKRKSIVVGIGPYKARVAFIGGGPGENEDNEGKPFVGKAGSLLDKMIFAMHLRREDVFIVNIVACRPPDNRDPEPDEVSMCFPYLLDQLRCIEPEFIVALGRIAASTLRYGILSSDSLQSVRKEGIFKCASLKTKTLATYHPEYLLRYPEQKARVWKDLQKVMTELHL